MPFKAATVTMTATTVGRMIKLQAKAQMLGQGFVWGELVNADGSERLPGHFEPD